MDISRELTSFAARFQSLPLELVESFTNVRNADFLNALSATALNPNFTHEIFAYFHRLAFDICARWTSKQYSLAISAYGRVISSLPHLSEAAQNFSTEYSQNPDLLESLDLSDARNDSTREILLGVFRLLAFDNHSYAKLLKPAKLQLCLQHQDRSIRYIAIRILCLYLHASDKVMQDMIAKYLSSGPVEGPWEGKTIDYRFLTLWEERRVTDFTVTFAQIHDLNDMEPVKGQLDKIILPQELHAAVVDVFGVLLPRSPLNSDHVDHSTTIIPTQTMVGNVRCVANGLTLSRPLLLTGQSGSGKTLLVKHLAALLHKASSMVTLHLNEQSDAKLLLGLYTTAEQPGSFKWQPGVLTTAVREGRWVFIEDLDRAPKEVLSTILPLIETNELVIPGRSEKIRAAKGFKIIATMRSHVNMSGRETVPTSRMLGARLWQRIAIQSPTSEELYKIVAGKYPALTKLLPRILGVFTRLGQEAALEGTLSHRNRPISSRELLNWAGRINVLFIRSANDSQTMDEPLSEQAIDSIFLDAIDCFAGNIEEDHLRDLVIALIAEELQFGSRRARHLLEERKVQHKVHQEKSGATFIVGRATLQRIDANATKTKSGSPFAINGHSLRLLEKIAVATQRREPLLLVGETGIGKTTAIQHLARTLGHRLLVINLSQQSESGDLLGGFKPVNIRNLIMPLKEEFDLLFEQSFSPKKNQRFIEVLKKSVANAHWKRVLKLWKEAQKMVDKTLGSAIEPEPKTSNEGTEQSAKRRKIISSRPIPDRGKWDDFTTRVELLEQRLSASSSAFAFAFMEGKLVKAVREGQWVLLDEINLATTDTLECLADLLEGGPDSRPSLLLTEKGSVERIAAHPNFRIFAAMNPATDVGKRELPIGIRSRFTEIYVTSPDTDFKSLQNIVETYLEGVTTVTNRKIAVSVSELYMEIQHLLSEAEITDGSNQKPHFSLRSLTRALTHAKSILSQCGLNRALFEGFCMCFATCLSLESEQKILEILKQRIFADAKIAKGELKKPLRRPESVKEHAQILLSIQPLEKGKSVKQELHWLPRGGLPLEDPEGYIVTPFIRRNLENLIRAASSGKYPMLIQGPTSAGKTSMVEYLAKRSGNKFVRINNHEHTDLQEYLGTYISTSDGKLVFQEGVLVKALREGHWVVLDELNLAPTDVLEALNRLLDDNRELLIPETQEIIRPHSNFLLFATQNPPGPYGGRKVLSRAFRNRFLELQFDDIPVEELNIILSKRSNLPQSWCGKIVEVYKMLSQLRQENRIFEQHSFATLRDLFRWAFRGADSVEELANNGYMLLAEKVRKFEERKSVKEVIERVMSGKGVQVTIDEAILYDVGDSNEAKQYDALNGGNILWTKAMRRLFLLVARAVRHNEPVLLVGETGCGKTTVCQMLAEGFEKQLHIINAHQNTETGDLIGAQRPVRNRAALEDQLARDIRDVLKSVGSQENIDLMNIEGLLSIYDSMSKEQLASIPHKVSHDIKKNRASRNALFEWYDGSIVQAMRSGDFYLLDEISLADDSVLERLNSVLDPQRSLLLAEKGTNDSLVIANEGFQFFATMNPGGDFGKKELSPALRNRFTEIWVPPLTDLEDVLEIATAKLRSDAKDFAKTIVNFAHWFNLRYSPLKSASISIRDILAWVQFINIQSLYPLDATIHGALMVFIDTLGANPSALVSMAGRGIDEERNACLTKLGELLGFDIFQKYHQPIEFHLNTDTLQVGAFKLLKSSSGILDKTFHFEAHTAKMNAMRIVRALQLPKPILLEGNPGVGKTSIITAIAKAVGKPLTRINLSEQTDLMDLFGSDVPVEGGEAGQFAWQDAPYLTAMKTGGWVLLDEMNLATQSVLEGLNACLDHRAEIYVAELNQHFKRHPDFRLFAAQNPHHQGSGRKGLPSSFVNRFTVVYADVFKQDDLISICTQMFPETSASSIQQAVEFVTHLERQISNRRGFGVAGSPWEFNLRDTIRWLQLLSSREGLLPAGNPRDFFDCLFAQRFRSKVDVEAVGHIFEAIFNQTLEPRNVPISISAQALQIGLGCLRRSHGSSRAQKPSRMELKQKMLTMESLMICVQQRWPVILVGSSGAGKTTLLQVLASLVGAELEVFPMSSDIDATDLVGGYEQVDPSRQLEYFLKRLWNFVQLWLAQSLAKGAASESDHLLLDILNTLLRSATSDIDFNVIHNKLLQVAKQHDCEEMESIALDCKNAHNFPRVVESARFEWVDGTLIEAIEQGKWLVLDNANLCSSSVLDRLNSLLEPDGYLIVNEHCNEDGLAKTIKPHPNFRIFLTMDPQYGEVSRAMRNRSVELFIQHDLAERMADHQPYEINSESNMMTLRHLVVSCDNMHNYTQPERSIDAAMGCLSLADAEIFPQFVKQLQCGLLSKPPSTIYANIERLDLSLSLDNWLEPIHRYYETVVSHVISPSRDLSKVQPIQPLYNETLVAYNQKISESPDPYWLNSIYALTLDLAEMEQQLRSIKGDLEFGKSDTRLQRAFAGQFETKSNSESTSKVATFLLSTQETLVQWIKNKIVKGQRDRDRATLMLIQHLRSFWWHISQVVGSSDFDDAMYQAYLLHEEQKLATFTTNAEVDLINTAQLNLQRLKAFSEPATGQSMERLWSMFRPKTVTSFKHLYSLIQLESLAQRFDDLLWRVTVPISRLVELQRATLKTLDLAQEHGVDLNGLIQDLEKSLQDFDEQEDAQTQHPLFLEVFEGLCQYRDLQEAFNEQDFALSGFNIEISTFARRSTRSLVRSIFPSDTARMLATLSSYLGNAGVKHEPLALKGQVGCLALMKILNVPDIALARLELLESELPLLGRTIATQVGTLMCDQHQLLRTLLLSLILQIVEAHRDILNLEESNMLTAIFQLQTIRTEISLEDVREASERLLHLLNGSLSLGFRQNIFSNHLVPSLQCLIESCKDSTALLKLGTAFRHCSYACIMLYVPDRLFDPALLAVAGKHLFSRQRQDLDAQLTGIVELEHSFSGNRSNLRSRAVQQQIVELGHPPVDVEIPRPPKSRLYHLQNDFTALLRMTESAMRSNMTRDAVAETLKNSEEIVDRLQRNHRVYADLTVPAIGFLNCHTIGLLLECGGRQSGRENFVDHIVKHTPLLGAPVHCRNLDLATNYERSEAAVEHSLRVHALRFKVEHPSSRSRSMLENLNSYLDFFYHLWKTQLEKDREREVASSSIYRYKGDQEDILTDEEFEAMFPSYDGHEDGGEAYRNSNTRNQKQLAILMADVHADIFLDQQSSALSDLMKLLESVGITIGQETKNATPNVLNVDNAQLLPVIMLTTLQRQEELRSTKALEEYNIYEDSNLPELKKMVSLAKDIQQRFITIQKVWPEYATLQNVLDFCNQLLDFRVTDPVMKILTKAEQLHGYIAEWQSVASREHSVAESFNKLTDLIVGWRRMELSTWSQLLNKEVAKCEEDARSWWFILYENIAYNSSSEMVDVIGILSTLQQFFINSTIGQFDTKIKMLRSLVAHLQFSKRHIHDTSNLSTPLENLLHYYARFCTSVKEEITKTRQNLEKDLKDVIKLASWNDRNVDSLKQSARSSHRKLFRLVRKFRDALNQPVQPYLKVSSTSYELDQQLEGSEAISRPAEAKSAASLHSGDNSVWRERPVRFRNMEITASRAYSIAQLPDVVKVKHKFLDEFVESLDGSIRELRKATPSALTEENSATVKHLTTRKRKLLSDTLKYIRQLGIFGNLSATQLAVQDSLPKVLARLPTVSDMRNLPLISASESTLQQTLDLMPSARSSLRDHSDDLYSADVERALGYLESLLTLTIKQRVNLGRHSEQLHSLQSTVRHMSSLWGADGVQVKPANSLDIAFADNIRKHVSWLALVISATQKLLEAQSQLGDLNFSSLLDELQVWNSTFSSMASEFEEPHIPHGVQSLKRIHLVEDLLRDYRLFSEKIPELKAKEPNAAAVLDLLSAWAHAPEYEGSASIDEIRSGDPGDHCGKIINALDLVLGSIQDVESALQGAQATEDDQAWLTKNDSYFSSLLNAYHTPRVLAALDDLLLQLKPPQAPGGAAHFVQYTASLYLAAEIVEQYQHAFEQTLASYAALHNSTCHAMNELTKHFCNLAKEGFCTPREQSNEKAGTSEKLEAGTGLGEGEGEEDISKDIGGDEDLSELAEDQQNRNQEGDVDENSDAVDIEDNLEGGKGDTVPEQDEKDEEGDAKTDEQDMQSEEGQDDRGMDKGGGEDFGEDDAEDEGMGEVGDQEPSAVDEKMWDNPEGDTAADKEGEQPTGTRNEKEQVGTSENKKTQEAGDTERIDGGDEESLSSKDEEDDSISAEHDNEADGDAETTDPHLKESEGLELPEELKLDGAQKSDKDEDSDDDLADAMDVDENEEPDADESVEQENTMDDRIDFGETDQQNGYEGEDNTEDSQLNDAEAAAGGPDHHINDDKDQGYGQHDLESHEAKDEHRNEMDIPGAGMEQPQQDQAVSSSSAQRQSGARTEAETKQSQDAQGEEDIDGGSSQQQESKDLQAFRKLGDILEKWHKQQQRIRNPSQDQKRNDPRQSDEDVANADFEHLPEEQADADTQAMGPSTKEQATTVDDRMAMEEETVGDQDPENMPSIGDENDHDSDEDKDMAEADELSRQQPVDDSLLQSNTFVGDRRDNRSSPADNNESPIEDNEEYPEDSSIQDDMSTLQLEGQIQDAESLIIDPQALWSYYLSLTRTASLHLIEQLRLILEPTRATKLSGAYRTGKRLNIKRIIPYIASSYKRDKIWLRRSVPQKREYQICLAIDDSRSMDPHGLALGDQVAQVENTHQNQDSPAALAFQTLALLSSSLHALDAGSLAVLAFGSTTTTAHDLSTPWSASAGAAALSHFTFAQTSTDVGIMVDRAVDMFREARFRRADNETWQICLVVGDGVFGEHDQVRRRVIQAKEERVMFVFVVVDAVARPSASSNSASGKARSASSNNKQSILDLETVEFVQAPGAGDDEGEGSQLPQVKRTKYLDTFPFEFYLIVRDVTELPGVLAAALRQWFGEIGGVV